MFQAGRIGIDMKLFSLLLFGVLTPSCAAALEDGLSPGTNLEKTIVMHRVVSDPLVENLEKLKGALDSGADINFPHPHTKQTALMSAVLGGKAKTVEMLLDRGADTSIPEKDGYTPVHGAGFQGRAEVMRVLIAHGFDVYDVHEDGYSAIHRACWGKESRHTDTVRVLLEHGVSPYLPTQGAQGGITCEQMTPSKETKILIAEYQKAGIGSDL